MNGKSMKITKNESIAILPGDMTKKNGESLSTRFASVYSTYILIAVVRIFKLLVSQTTVTFSMIPSSKV